jgi:hypothetical protein
MRKPPNNKKPLKMKRKKFLRRRLNPSQRNLRNPKAKRAKVKMTRRRRLLLKSQLLRRIVMPLKNQRVRKSLKRKSQKRNLKWSLKNLLRKKKLTSSTCLVNN